jgi:hypothetical protein
VPRARGGDWLDDEMHTLRQAGVDLLACLLTTSEYDELEVATRERMRLNRAVDGRKTRLPLVPHACEVLRLCPVNSTGSSIPDAESPGLFAVSVLRANLRVG